MCAVFVTSLSFAAGDPTPTPAVMAPPQLSLDYSDANLSTVLKSIAFSYNLNLVIANEVKGKVSAQLKNVSLDDALDAILKVNKYAFSRKDNILYVMPLNDVDLKTEFISLNYILAKEAKSFVYKLLSKRGEIQINEGTNSLIVRDFPDNIAKVKEILAGTDQQPLQVLIEAKLVDIKTTDSQNLGTVLTATLNNSSGHLGSATLKTGASMDRGVGGALDLVPRFKSLTNTDVTISALVEKQRARVLASPSIATLSGLEAKIIIGDRIPYKNSTSAITAGSGNTTTTSAITFVEVGTSLKVTPLVSPDGWITMKIHPEVSKVTGYSSDGAPLVGTREADATIRVKDNETIIIGGLISNDHSSNDDGVPGLRSIPVLGWFFKSHVNSDIKSELMVFITPHIMRSPAATSAPANAPKPLDIKPVAVTLPNEVRIDSETLSQESDMLAGLLSYVNDLEADANKKKSDDLYLTLELVKTYRMILKEFPQSGKSDYCLSKIAALYVKKFGKCGPAQEALKQLETGYPQSQYLDETKFLVQTCSNPQK